MNWMKGIKRDERNVIFQKEAKQKLKSSELVNQLTENKKQEKAEIKR